MSTDSIDRFSGWSEDRLFAEIGQDLSQRDWSPGTFRSLAAAGRSWINQNASQIRQRVCGRVRDDGSDPAIVISAIADAISGMLGKPTIFAAAVLIYRYGLDKLCVDFVSGAGEDGEGTESQDRD